MAFSINPIIIAVDFDGCLCENRFPDIGEPKLEVIEKLKQLQKGKGVELILWTCREGYKLDEAVAWCTEQGLEFEAINDEVPRIKEAFKTGAEIRSALLKNETRCGAKIFANWYIDDRAINVEDF